MQEFVITKALADCDAIGDSLFTGEKWVSVNYPRILSAIGVVGSTNVADFEVEIWAGETRKGSFKNTKGGANVGVTKEDWQYPKILVPANAEIQCRVTDVAAGNPVIIAIKLDSKTTRRFQRGGSSRIRNPTAYAAAVARNRGQYTRRY